MKQPRDFDRLGDHLQSAVPRLIRRRRRIRLVLVTVLAFAALSGASIAGSPRVRDLLGIDDNFEVVEEGTVEGVPYAGSSSGTRAPRVPGWANPRSAAVETVLKNSCAGRG
jgi:hypothetical protein